MPWCRTAVAFCAALVVLAYVNLCQGQEFHRELDPKRLDSKTFKTGAFTVPLAKPLKKDWKATKRLLAILEWFELQVKADGAMLEALGDQHWKLCHADELLECNVLLSFCEQYKGTEASLTAALLLPSIVEGAHKTTYKPLRAAVKRIRTDFPDSWHAKVAPLIEATLIARTQNIPEKERISIAMKFLEDTLPPKGTFLPMDNEEVKVVLKASGFKPPVRAAHLMGIAYSTFELSSVDGPYDKRLLKETVKACERVIQEFPGTRYAERAENIAYDIVPMAMVNDDPTKLNKVTNPKR